MIKKVGLILIIALTDSDKTKFDFYIWNYKNKFNFKGNKFKLIKDGELSN